MYFEFLLEVSVCFLDKSFARTSRDLAGPATTKRCLASLSVQQQISTKITLSENVAKWQTTSNFLASHRTTIHDESSLLDLFVCDEKLSPLLMLLWRRSSKGHLLSYWSPIGLPLDFCRQSDEKKSQQQDRKI